MYLYDSQVHIGHIPQKRIQKLFGNDEDENLALLSPPPPSPPRTRPSPSAPFPPGVTLTNGSTLEIDLNIISLTDLLQIFSVHSTCDTCKLTLQTFLTLHRQCKICLPNTFSPAFVPLSFNSSPFVIPTTLPVPPPPMVSQKKRISFNYRLSNLSLNDAKQQQSTVVHEKQEKNDAKQQQSTVVHEKQEKKQKNKKKEQTLTEFIPSLPTKNWKDRLSIGIQIAEGILHYHEEKRTHQNICADNIIVKKEKWYLIKDKEKIIIEPEWTAPELILIKNQPSPPTDIFGFAFVLYSLWNAETPWMDLSRKNICDQICLGARPEFNNNIPAPDKYKELIEKCWHQESQNRPPIANVLGELKAMSANITPELEALLVVSNLPQGLQKYRIVKFIDSTLTCLIQDKSNDKKYAMKIRKKLNAIEKYEEEHKTLLKVSSCYYVVQFHEGFLWDFQGDWGMKWCLVYSYYENGNLYAKIAEAKERKTLTGKGIQEDERQVIDWIIQLSEGLSFLHNMDIIHRNVKSSKIFLDSFNGVKLGDIGLTKDLEEDEIKHLTKESNVKSLGIILLELLSLNVGITEAEWRNYLCLIPKEFSPNWDSVVTNVLQGRSSLSLLVKALRDISPLQESETAIDSLLNMSHVEKRNTQAPPSDDEKGENFTCDYPGCNQDYKKQILLTRHKKTHLTSPYVCCHWCSKAFVDASSLARHERSHSGWKPYPCPYQLTCGKRFVEEANLIQHIKRTHNGVAIPPV